MIFTVAFVVMVLVCGYYAFKDDDWGRQVEKLNTCRIGEYERYKSLSCLPMLTYW